MKSIRMSAWQLLVIWAVFGAIAATGCKEDQSTISPDEIGICGGALHACTDMAQTSGWTAEPFKTGYTIQFPSSWEGRGMVSIEGNTFRKGHNEPFAELVYFYCGAVFCEDFREELPTPDPVSLQQLDADGLPIELNIIEKFCENGEVVAMLYYSTKTSQSGLRSGQLYMKSDDVFREGLMLTYAPAVQDEIIEIVKSIMKE